MKKTLKFLELKTKYLGTLKTMLYITDGLPLLFIFLTIIIIKEICKLIVWFVEKILIISIQKW